MTKRPNLPPLTAEQRTLRARTAALARWSKEDPEPAARRANAGHLDRCRREIETEFPGLPEAELERRAVARFRQHMTALALKSSRARAARREANGGGRNA